MRREDLVVFAECVISMWVLVQRCARTGSIRRGGRAAAPLHWEDRGTRQDSRLMIRREIGRLLLSEQNISTNNGIFAEFILFIHSFRNCDSFQCCHLSRAFSFSGVRRIRDSPFSVWSIHLLPLMSRIYNDHWQTSWPPVWWCNRGCPQPRRYMPEYSIQVSRI